MSEKVGIITSPVFDTTVFRVGKAVEISGPGINKHALITQVNPITISIVYRLSGGDDEEINIPVADVINSKYYIYPLERVKA